MSLWLSISFLSARARHSTDHLNEVFWHGAIERNSCGLIACFIFDVVRDSWVWSIWVLDIIELPWSLGSSQVINWGELSVAFFVQEVVVKNEFVGNVSDPIFVWTKFLSRAGFKDQRLLVVKCFNKHLTVNIVNFPNEGCSVRNAVKNGVWD